MDDLRKYETQARIMAEAEERSNKAYIKEDVKPKSASKVKNEVLPSENRVARKNLNEALRSLFKDALFGDINEMYASPVMGNSEWVDKTPEKIKQLQAYINSINAMTYQIGDAYNRQNADEEVTKIVTDACEKALDLTIKKMIDFWIDPKDSDEQAELDKKLEKEEEKETEEETAEEQKKEVETVKGDINDVMAQIMGLIAKQEAITSPTGEILIAESVTVNNLVSVINKTKAKRQTVAPEIFLNWSKKK